MTEKDPKDILKSSDAARVKAYHNYLAKIQSGKTLSKSEFDAFKALEDEIGGMKDTPKRCKSVLDVAKLTGFSTRKIYWHITRGNLEQNADGSFDMAKLDAWAAKYKKNTSVSGKKSTREKKEIADLMWKEYRTEKERIILDQVKGNLYPREIVDEALEEIIQVTKRAFQLIPDHASSAMVGMAPEGQRAVLQGLVDDILTGLSERATIGEIESRIKESV